MTTTVGVIRESEGYTVKQLAAILNESERKIHDTFIVPRNPSTRGRLIGRDGKPVRGVRRVRLGALYLFTGRDLLAWIAENARYADEDVELGEEGAFAPGGWHEGREVDEAAAAPAVRRRRRAAGEVCQEEQRA